MTEPSTEHGSRGVALLALLVVGGSALGAFLYQSSQNSARPAPDNTGFDLIQADPRPKHSAFSTGPGAGSEQRSGLAMVKTGIPGMQFGAQKAAAAARNPEKSFADLTRAQEAKMRALNQAYTAKYPVIAQFRREWLANPELKRLRDGFCGPAANTCGAGGDHDPIKFIRGVMASQSFKQLLPKYAQDPAVHAYVMDAVKQAPANLIAAASDFLNQDNNTKNFLDGIAQSLGLPAGMLGGGNAKVDQNAVLGSILNNNPELNKALENANAQKR